MIVISNYKCVNCGVIKEEGSSVYFINSLDDFLPSPTCSQECAREENELNIKILEDRINKIKQTIIIEEMW